MAGLQFKWPGGQCAQWYTLALRTVVAYGGISVIMKSQIYLLENFLVPLN